MAAHSARQLARPSGRPGSRLDVVVADQPGRAGRVGVEHRGEIAHGLRGVHEHAAQLAAAHHAQRGAGQGAWCSSGLWAPAGMALMPPVGASWRAPRRSGGAEGSSRRAAPHRRWPAWPPQTARRWPRPAAPMAKVATGMPLGICTMLCSESTPRRCLRLPPARPAPAPVVLAASMPGRWAAPPAPAMMALSPRPAAPRHRRTCRPACGGPTPPAPRGRYRIVGESGLRAAWCPSRCWNP
jgi:hypothetical protein